MFNHNPLVDTRVMTTQSAGYVNTVYADMPLMTNMGKLSIFVEMAAHNSNSTSHYNKSIKLRFGIISVSTCAQFTGINTHR